MTSQLMNHDEAVKTLATERYLLREMNDEQRRDFEEHYLGCPECFEAVMFASDFVSEMRNVSLPAPAPSFREKLARFFASLMRPAPALAFAVLLTMIGYQSFRIHQLSNEEGTKVATPEFRYVLTGIAHGAGEAKLVNVTRNAVVSLGVEYNRNGEYVSYRAEVVSDSGKVKQTIDLPDMAGNMATIALMPKSLEPGLYSVVITGQAADGSQKEVGRGSFVLKFID